MLPRHEVTIDINWKPEKLDEAVEAGTHSKEGTPLGILESFSPPLKSILEESFSSDKNDTYMRSIGNTLMAALERRYPGIISASLTLSGRVKVRKDDSEVQGSQQE